jgi:hypothetical protein
MTITFESDTDTIVYAFEKVISYARNNQYIFLAQNVWWISSIIGLQQELVTYVHNLRCCDNQILSRRSESEVVNKAPRLYTDPKECCDRTESDISRNLQEEPQKKFDSQSIHLDRISQVSDRVVASHIDSVLKKSEEFLRKSQIERKRFYPLRCTRQGKVQPRKSAKVE